MRKVSRALLLPEPRLGLEAFSELRHAVLLVRCNPLVLALPSSYPV